MGACRTALLALVPAGGVLLCDKRTYYEVGNEILRLSIENKWTVEYTNFSDPDLVRETCAKLDAEGKAPNVFYFDSPTNWWLECLDFEVIKKIANKYGAKTVVDISIQPLQVEALQCLDVVAFSLSKYPSAGLTLGGAISTNDLSSHTAIEAVISRTGDRLSGDTAAIIWCQVVSLRDRLESLDRKITKIERAVSSLPGVHRVRTIERRNSGNLAGGILVLELQDRRIGTCVENIVGHNSGRRKAALHLAYTFGGVMTTLEHFNSNPRRISLRNENLLPFPDTFLRIGVGCEPVDDIISDLTMVLNPAWDLNKGNH